MSVEQRAEVEIECRVVKVLSDHFPLGQRKVEICSSLVQDLYLDSMSLVEVVMALNETFGIELPETEVREWRSVVDIVRSVQSELPKY